MSRVRITFGDLEHLHQKMRKVMGEVFSRSPLGMGQGWRPAVDICEDADNVVLVAELAGVQRGDIEVTIGGSIVRISGKRTSAPPPGPVRFLQLEIDHGAFERIFRLPVAVDDRAATATLRDGYLRVSLPKRKSESRSISIEQC
jgi:HSP20 family protein